MTEFERQLADGFNQYFDNRDIDAIAYRRKQHRFSSQVLDILVDSFDRKYYLGVECKSISLAKGTNKLYFSQHFSDEQIERINRFLEKSGRAGWLAVELKKGKGHLREAHLVPWKEVIDKKNNEEKGLSVEEIKGHMGTELIREGGNYDVSPLFE